MEVEMRDKPPKTPGNDRQKDGQTENGNEQGGPTTHPKNTPELPEEDGMSRGTEPAQGGGAPGKGE